MDKTGNQAFQASCEASQIPNDTFERGRRCLHAIGLILARDLALRRGKHFITCSTYLQVTELNDRQFLSLAKRQWVFLLRLSFLMELS